jgi:hypothetical protein
MLERIIGDARRTAATELRLIAIAGAAALGATATLSLLCAAAFVFVMDRYNVLDACLTSGSPRWRRSLARRWPLRRNRRRTNDAKREANHNKRRSSKSLLWRLLTVDIKLDDAHERKNEKDNQDCSKSPNWVVAPTSAVRPGGQRTDHEEDEDDKDNETHVRPRAAYAARAAHPSTP